MSSHYSYSNKANIIHHKTTAQLIVVAINLVHLQTEPTSGVL